MTLPVFVENFSPGQMNLSCPYIPPDVTPAPQAEGGCGGGCIAGIIIGTLALLLAAIVAAIIFAVYKHLSNPATQLKKGEAEGLNG